VKPLRAPLLHFLAIGAVLFALQGALSPSSPRVPVRSVTLPAAEFERLAHEARRETGRPASPQQIEPRVRAWVDEELLFREAVALGWNRSDPVVQQRLIRNLRFLDADADDDPATLLAQAYALGMDRGDLVVRRRLVQRMKLAITAAARAAEPSDAELEALLQRDPARYRRPARARLTQVFVSRDRHGDGMEAAARALLAKLEAAGVAPQQAAGRGDPFLLPASLPLWSERRLAARLGPEFARRALQAKPGAWSGPIPSSYGLHLVWVHERAPDAMPPLAELRHELRAAWRAEREQRALRSALDALRRDVEVRIEQG
jgi:hypothetical protein